MTRKVKTESALAKAERSIQGLPDHKRTNDAVVKLLAALKDHEERILKLEKKGKRNG